MDLEIIKRGLRAEIKKRENEQYFTFQTNIRQMCKDVLAKLEEQESAIIELKDKCQMHDFFWEVCGFAKLEKKSDLYKRGWAENDKINAHLYAELRHNKYKRCLAMAEWCECRWADIATQYYKSVWYRKWQLRWLALAEKFKEAK